MRVRLRSRVGLDKDKPSFYAARVMNLRHFQDTYCLDTGSIPIPWDIAEALYDFDFDKKQPIFVEWLRMHNYRITFRANDFEYCSSDEVHFYPDDPTD